MENKNIILWDSRELEMIEYQARKEKMTSVDYIRMCVYLTMFLSGNFAVMKTMSSRIKFYLLEYLKKFMSQEKKTNENAENWT